MPNHYFRAGGDRAVQVYPDEQLWVAQQRETLPGPEGRHTSVGIGFLKAYFLQPFWSTDLTRLQAQLERLKLYSRSDAPNLPSRQLCPNLPEPPLWSSFPNLAIKRISRHMHLTRNLVRRQRAQKH